MRYLSVTFGNVRVVFRVEKDNVRTTVNGKDYMVSRDGDAATFSDPPDDLSEDLQGNILRTIKHYFTRQK